MFRSILSFLILVFATHQPVGAQTTIEMQNALSSVGCYDGEINGKVSLKLRSAVRCYQNSQSGWDVDGSLDANEWTTLLEDVAQGFSVSDPRLSPNYSPSQPDGGELAEMGAETTERSLYNANIDFIMHVGFWLGQNYEVIEVVPNSPAAIAGVQVGDRWGGQIGNGGYSADVWSRAKLLEHSSRRLQHSVGYGPLNFSFVRQGRARSYPFLPIRRGESLNAPNLRDGERERFDRLPNVLQQFYAFIYLGEFQFARDYQMYVFDTYFRGSSVGAVSKLFGVDDEFRDAFARSRGSGIFSQYILIKTNALGLCGEPGTGVRVEQARYQVLVDSYGFEWGARREIEPRVYEFIVPEHWSGILRKNAPMGEARAWKADILAFIHAAGGCGSPILAQLEKNMLAYLRIGS
ncbi:MAG: peptidoglycan-binding protein [Pseudomonadota bacterium]